MADPYCTLHGHGCSSLHPNLSYISAQPKAIPSHVSPFPNPLYGRPDPETGRPSALAAVTSSESSFPGQQSTEGGRLRPRPLASRGESVKRLEGCVKERASFGKRKIVFS